MKVLRLVGAVCLMLAAGVSAGEPSVEHGRYLARTTGCADCHTAGYMQRNGEVPESEWLLGDNVGWRGPWGTTYAVNLRLYVEPLSEAQWVTIARNKPSRPPMPWYALRDMSDDDLRSLYRFIRSLGPAGRSAPAFVPPDQEPTTAYVLMTPQLPAGGSATPAAAQPKTEKEKSFWDFDFKAAPPRLERP